MMMVDVDDMGTSAKDVASLPSGISGEE